MGAASARVQTYRAHPVAHDPGIVPRGQMRAGLETAWPEILTANHFRSLDPSLQGDARRVGDLEVDRRACLLCVTEARSLTPPAA